MLNSQHLWSSRPCPIQFCNAARMLQLPPYSIHGLGNNRDILHRSWFDAPLPLCTEEKETDQATEKEQANSQAND